MPRVEEEEERTLVLLEDGSKQSSAVAFSDQTASETDVVAGGRIDEGQRLPMYLLPVLICTHVSIMMSSYPPPWKRPLKKAGAE